MITWSKLPKIDLTIAAAISLETAGFIGNKYSHFYGFIYMFIVVLVIIFMISLDTVKNKKIVEARIPKNNIRAIESEIKIENKIGQRQWFWHGD
mgnify:CR=1 FL=1|tara:strand:- start:832 stop:1113 length:282 start_codon:yes stop_codon:yes gene_type:complete